MSLEKTVTPPPDFVPADEVPLPPKNAETHSTVCDYCVVGCGYKVYIWPQGKAGGPAPGENALGANIPERPMSGRWISPNQHAIVNKDGKPHHVVIAADPDATVVNRGGNFSIRGGALAKKCYSADSPTRDRLKTPLMRVKGKLVPVSWETAFAVMAGVSKHVLKKNGQLAWGMKTFDYHSFETTYAISKICFESIKTPAYAPHSAPTAGDAAAGVTDSGFMNFGNSMEDMALADVVYLSGSDPYESKTVLYTDWLMKGGAKQIMATPRKSMGVAYAEENGGLWLDVIPGTDTILHLAVIRYILEQGWEDKAFILKWTANKWEIDSGFGRGSRDSPVQWRTTWSKYGTDYKGYRRWLLAYKPAKLSEAARLTGVSKEKIVRTAEMLTGGGGARPKASFFYEKGNYWSNNYLNTASYAALALICGAGNRPGRVVGRLGGHQRGWASMAEPYPIALSPEKLHGRRRKHMDLDKWVCGGHLRFAWVIGTTWIQCAAASDELLRSIFSLTRRNKHQIKSKNPQSAIKTLIKRADSGGMVLVDQDIYLRDPVGSELADLVLPATAWGEHDFARANWERRLRLYPKFYDPPGEAKPDWWIISRFARAMGFTEYRWESANEVFEEAARFSRGRELDYHSLVWYAKKIGVPAHEVLRELGTTGIQLPARYRLKPTEGKKYLSYTGSYKSPKFPGVVVGTKRLHDTDTDFGTPEGPTMHPRFLTAFNSHTGKALLHKSPWETFSDFYKAVRPKDGELWITNGRVNETWGSSYDDQRRPYILQRWPDNFLEMHPEDAAGLGIESGDYVEVSSDDVPVQTGGYLGVEPNDLLFSTLVKKKYIRRGKGSFRAVAILTDAIRPGVCFTICVWPSSRANSVVPRVPDPMTNHYRYKLGKGRVKKVGESPYKNSLEKMSFLPRTII